MTITVRKDSTGTVSVSRMTFDDLSTLGTSEHISPANQGHYARCVAERAMENAAWYGGLHGVADACALLASGWAEGAAKAAALAPSLTPLVKPVASVRKRLRWADDGSELNLDRALAGQWDNAWRNTERRQGNAPRILSLACAFGASGMVSHESLFWNAAQMIVAADLLENAGYAVELRAVENTGVSQGRHALIDILVKAADQPLRPDAIAAVFGHAGVYRTLGFATTMTSPFDNGWGLGRVEPVRATLEKMTEAGLCESAGYILGHAYSLEQAVTNIVSALTTLTGDANA